MTISLYSSIRAENIWPKKARPCPKATQRKRFDCLFGKAFSAVFDLFQE